MRKAIEETQKEFESSCERTPEYREWHRIFKREFKAYLSSKGATNVEIGKPNHFDMSGFFTSKTGQIYYFSIGDLRWSKSQMLIRTAKDYKDYTGGSNGFASLKSVEEFDEEFNYQVR